METRCRKAAGVGVILSENAHRGHELTHPGNIFNAGYIQKTQFVLKKDGGSHRRQYRIFCTGNRNGTIEALFAAKAHDLKGIGHNACIVTRAGSLCYHEALCPVLQLSPLSPICRGKVGKTNQKNIVRFLFALGCSTGYAAYPRYSHSSSRRRTTSNLLFRRPHEGRVCSISAASFKGGACTCD